MVKVELDSEVLRALIARQCETGDVVDVTLVLERRSDTFKCVPTRTAKSDCDLWPIFEFADMDFPASRLGAPALVLAWLERSMVWAEITQCIEFTLEQNGSWPKWMDCSHFAIGGTELAGRNW